MNLSKKSSKSSYVIGLITASLSIITVISAVLLSIPVTNAVTSSAGAAITVSMACSMAVTPGTGGTATSDGYSYSATVTPGVPSEISGSILTTTCNGPGNYSLYAIGYSGDSYDTPTNTQMISSAGSNNIVTGTATSGSTSNWAFKLASVSGTSAPTIVSPYSNYSNVPGADFAKVATMLGTTGLASTSAVQAKYQVYASSTQPAGAYTGKVKYTMVYPNDAPAPTPPPGLCTDTATCMQTMTSCPTTATTVTDSRDGEQYKVQQLADGKCWMLDNLRLGSNFAINLTPSDTNINNDWTLPASTTNGFDYSIGYTTAAINTNSKNNTTTGYGDGSSKIGNYYNFCAASGGTYCYSSGSSTGDAQYDVCPFGWRMPTGGPSGEYQTLYTSYGSDATSFRNALSTPLSGYFDRGSAYSQGSYGRFWSSIYYDGYYMYNLQLSSYDVLPNEKLPRYYGISMRCLLKT